MSNSPFGTVGGSQPQESAPAPQSGAPKHKKVTLLIGIILILGGFAWKFIAGTAASGEEVSFLDFLWLAPVVVGAIVFLVGRRRTR